MESWYVYVRFLPLYDVWYPRCGSGYDSDGKGRKEKSSDWSCCLRSSLCVCLRRYRTFRIWFYDLVFSAPLPAAANTWLILPLGLAAFVVFYLVFRFAIVKFNLKTPGREDDDVEAEKKAVLSNSDYADVARIVLEGLGGKENVTSLDNCITRLRMEIKDYTKVDEKKIKSAGVAGVMRPGKNSVQVIVGTKVQFVADEMKKML